MSGLIEIDNLRRTFRVRRGLFAPAVTLQAVAGVSLAVRKGEVLVCHVRGKGAKARVVAVERVDT